MFDSMVLTPPSAGDRLSPEAEELAALPTDRLADRIREFSAHLAAGEYRWLVLIAEFVRRDAHAPGGFHSPAHWLSWSCGLAPSAARERIRVAMALGDLPLVSEAFSTGQLSYSKVRALTRIADTDSEPELCELAKQTTAGQLEIIVRAWRRHHRDNDLDRARTQHDKRQISWRSDDDGCLVGNFCIQPEHAPGFEATIETFLPDPPPRDRDDLDTRPPTLRQRRADAFVAALDAAAGERNRPGAERVLAVIEVEAEVLADDTDGTCQIQGGPALAAETARRLTCDARTMEIQTDANGEVVSQTKPTATIPRSTRRAIARRDQGRCRFPGCDRTRLVEAHHLVHRAHGGTHDLANLATLCRYHHHLVHEGGFAISTPDGGTSFVFHRPDGTPVSCPASPPGCPQQLLATTTSDGPAINPRTMRGGTGERLDLDLTMWALLGNRRVRARRRARRASAEAPATERHGAAPPEHPQC